MKQHQKDFIALAIQQQAILFGDFTLKSGRRSPYFFNSSQFNNGKAMSLLGSFYAQALMESNIPFNMLFGPAYKGIPLVTTTAIALHQKFDKNIPFAFDRKEKKTHGEKGTLVGPPLQGQIVILDDTITAGTAINISLDLISKIPGAKPVAVLTALDRQEKGQGHLPASDEIEKTTGIPVISIVNLKHLLEYMKQDPSLYKHIEILEAHYLKNGVTTH